MALSRNDLRQNIGVLTGHCLLNAHTAIFADSAARKQNELNTFYVSVKPSAG